MFSFNEFIWHTESFFRNLLLYLQETLLPASDSEYVNETPPVDEWSDRKYLFYYAEEMV